MGTKLDLEQLRKEIRLLRRDRKLYYVLRDELGKRGWWKRRARGRRVKRG